MTRHWRGGRRGSVVGSWLLDLTATALAENPDLSNFTGTVQDSGEGRWPVMAAVEAGVPAEVLSASRYTPGFRFRQDHTFAEEVLSAMRYQFGGHVERRPAGSRPIRRDDSLKDSVWVVGYDRIPFFHMLHDHASS